MYYRISKNEKLLFFGKKIAQVWAVTLNRFNASTAPDFKQKQYLHRNLIQNTLDRLAYEPVT